MKHNANPISPGPHEVDPAIADHGSVRHQAAKGRGRQKPELKLTSMIDVVFLLLIFFVVTATFTIEEGTVLATLPGNSRPIGPAPPPQIPVAVELASADDGVTYRLTVDGLRVDSAADLSAMMTDRLQNGRLANDDLVMIKPQGHVRWEHVLNVYNACVSAELEQVSFAR